MSGYAWICPNNLVNEGHAHKPFARLRLTTGGELNATHNILRIYACGLGQDTCFSSTELHYRSRWNPETPTRSSLAASNNHSDRMQQRHHTLLGRFLCFTVACAPLEGLALLDISSSIFATGFVSPVFCVPKQVLQSHLFDETQIRISITLDSKWSPLWRRGEDFEFL
jgi:hypothetical protein